MGYSLERTFEEEIFDWCNGILAGVCVKVESCRKLSACQHHGKIGRLRLNSEGVKKRIE